MNIKKYLLIPMFMAVFLFSVSAQSNELIDQIITQDSARLDTASLIILQAAELLPLDANYDDVFDFLQNNKNLKRLAKKETINQGRLSLLIMISFDINGGVMYCITKSPRYAAREIKSLGGIIENASPYKVVSGQEVISLLSWALDYTGKGDIE